jgi:hypothetical protein
VANRRDAHERLSSSKEAAMRLIRKAQTILVMVLAAAVGGCAANGPSGAPSSPTPTITSPSAAPSVTPSTSSTPTSPSPTSTTPSAEWTVVSSRVAYEWSWPGGDPGASVTHTTSVPPVPQLIRIGVGDHPKDPGDRPYNRMSFSFTTGYPTYRFQYVNQLLADGSGQPIPLEGYGVLRIVFNPAQAHTTDGTASTIVSKPPAHLGLTRMASYAPAGDFEGYLSFGIGIAYPIQQSNPQIAVRVVEVTYANAQGQHRYVVAFDVDTT